MTHIFRCGAAFLVAAPATACDHPEPYYPEGDGVSLGGASAVANVCDEFCDASSAEGCQPAMAGCSASCQSIFRGTCEDKLAAWLECVPGHFYVECSIVEVGEGDLCAAAERELRKCLFCGDGEATLHGESGCNGSFACGLATSCNDEGSCICYDGEEEIGTCSALFTGARACLSHASCCAAFL